MPGGAAGAIAWIAAAVIPEIICGFSSRETWPDPGYLPHPDAGQSLAKSPASGASHPDEGLATSCALDLLAG